MTLAELIEALLIECAEREGGDLPTSASVIAELRQMPGGGQVIDLSEARQRKQEHDGDWLFGAR